MESWLIRLLLTAGAFLIVGMCAAARDNSTPSGGFLLVAWMDLYAMKEGSFSKEQEQQLAALRVQWERTTR